MKNRYLIFMSIVLLLMALPLAVSASAITSVSPQIIKPGDIVTVVGTGLSTVASVFVKTSAGKFTISQEYGLASISDTQIVFKFGQYNFPDRGTLGVDLWGDYDVDHWNYIEVLGKTVVPNAVTVYGAIPGKQGAEVEIHGTGWTSRQGVIKIGGIEANITYWPSGGSVKVIIPKNAPVGDAVPLDIYLRGPENELFLANSSTIKVYDAPDEEIISVTPSTAASGDIITINGNNLSSNFTYTVTISDTNTGQGNIGSNVAYVGGALQTTIPFVYVLNTEAIHPGYKQGLKPGIYDVTINSTTPDGFVEKKAALTIVEPNKKLISIDKSSAKPGDIIKIIGTGFSTDLTLIFSSEKSSGAVISHGTEFLIGSTNTTFTVKIPPFMLCDSCNIYLLGPDDVMYSSLKNAFTVTTDSTTATQPLPIPLSSTNLVDYGVTQKSISGRLVKLANSTTVYLVQDNKRLAFPNQRIYESWFGTDFSTVTKVAPEELSSYTLTKNVQYKPGTLIKIPSIPKVYLVTDNGMLRWISTEEKFKALGFSFNQVHDLPESFFLGYEIGQDI